MSRDFGKLASFNLSPHRITPKVGEYKPAGFAGGFSFWPNEGVSDGRDYSGNGKFPQDCVGQRSRPQYLSLTTMSA